MNRDILFSIASQESPSRDEYGKEPKFSRALLLDRIGDGNIRANGSRFLQLPTYLIADIVDLLYADNSSLGALALANSTCRQMARSGQFSTVTFNYSPQSRCIIEKIAEEHADPLASLNGALGRCVRKFTMVSPPERETIINGSLEDMTQLQSDQRYNTYRGQLIDLILLVLERAMPNLQVIEWLDDFQPNNDFLKRIMRSPAKSIKIGSLKMNPSPNPILLEEFDVSLTWPIQHLSFNPDDLLFMPSKLEEAILRSCASTVQSLNLSQVRVLKSDSMSVINGPIAFPQLTSLQLNVVLLSAADYSCLLGPRLRQLKLPFCYNSAELTEALARCDTLRDLETLAIPLIPIKKDDAERMFQFVVRHSRIKKLFVGEHMKAQGDDARLDDVLIPFLSPERFANLTSLQLSWGGGSTLEETKPHIAYVPFGSLCAIGTLTVLKQLSLAAGILTGDNCQWLIDHGQMRVALEKLQNLEILAFSRDTYRHGPNPNVEEYYSHRFITGQDVVDILHLKDEDLDDPYEDFEMPQRTTLSPDEEWIWERCHANRMIQEAERYSTVLRKLRWIYLGQRPMTVQESAHGGRRAVVPLTEVRDSCFTYLRELFTYKNMI
ncbi:hypothetical protein F4805DRAFT_473605 [Annulohypoxylon moriforme]|nr:hypothetical protein F4805DRAFT_473605 [Annulohypoxylon moriforme]